MELPSSPTELIGLHKLMCTYGFMRTVLLLFYTVIFTVLSSCSKSTARVHPVHKMNAETGVITLMSLLDGIIINNIIEI